MRPIMLLVLLAWVPFDSAAAQGAPTKLAADSVRRVALRELRVNGFTRLHVIGTGVVQGAVRAVGADSVLVEAAWPAGRLHHVAFAAVDTVWARRSHWKRVSMIAAGGLGAMGALLGYSVACDLSSEPGCEGSPVAGMLELGIPAAAIGALGGAALGSLFPRWERRFP